MIAMLILTENNGEFKQEHFHDISLLLSSCTDVVSADIPIALKEISNSILVNDKAEEFVKQPIENAAQWLKDNCKDTSILLDRFLHSHGHRALKEFDLMTDTWGMRPEILLSTLQTSLSVPDISFSGQAVGSTDPPTISETIKKLTSPKKKLTRPLLKKLVPYCRKSVANREETKAACIKVVHTVRLAFRHLANSMVQEGYLPEPELIHYMTINEIGSVLETRNAGIISKAWRRKRLLPNWESLQFIEFIHGNPRPLIIEKAGRNGSTENIKVTGTPVYPGTVSGRACVIHNFSQVSEIKKGDILITKCTDIGWSPYFPMLGGVVTEIGGLISHGAVVAREYGLPCIIGAQRATNIFETGDMVELIGEEGSLVKIE